MLSVREDLFFSWSSPNLWDRIGSLICEDLILFLQLFRPSLCKFWVAPHPNPELNSNYILVPPNPKLNSNYILGPPSIKGPKWGCEDVAFEVEYLCNGWVKKDEVNANLVLFNWPNFTVDTPIDFARGVHKSVNR